MGSSSSLQHQHQQQHQSPRSNQDNERRNPSLNDSDDRETVISDQQASSISTLRSGDSTTNRNTRNTFVHNAANHRISEQDDECLVETMGWIPEVRNTPNRPSNNLESDAISLPASDSSSSQEVEAQVTEGPCITREGCVNGISPISKKYWMCHNMNSLVFGYLSQRPIMSSRVGQPEDNLDFEDWEDYGIDGTRNKKGFSNDGGGTDGGPNIVFSLAAREATGLHPISRHHPLSLHLRSLGGHTLYDSLDRPSGGIPTEVSLLRNSVRKGDWVSTSTLISRISSRFLSEPNTERSTTGLASKEREAFVLSGGVPLLIQIFFTRDFLGDDLSSSLESFLKTQDARYLSSTLLNIKLAECWNEVLAMLRELVYAMPRELILDCHMTESDLSCVGHIKFITFLFSLLSHASCFDTCVSLLEEILSVISQNANCGMQPFFLGNVKGLYLLWNSFTPLQLAHFCRILALLVFEPDGCQENSSSGTSIHPASLKSLQLLQFRRDRSANHSRGDVIVDKNQSIILGDENLLKKLLSLLKVMNYAPELERSGVYHVMAHFPWITDTLGMLGFEELVDWDDTDRLDKLARKMTKRQAWIESRNGYAPLSQDNQELPPLSRLGNVADMLDSLSGPLLGNTGTASQLGPIFHVLNAAQLTGVTLGHHRPMTHSLTNNNEDTSPSSSSSRWESQSNSTHTNSLQNQPDEVAQDEPHVNPTTASRRHRIHIPEDAANELQFNALLITPYQVEVLFILCTLLGGKRKIDAQNFFASHGLINVLKEMFDRLSWGKNDSNNSNNNNADANDQNSSSQQQEPNQGIHGPGCECNPESALRVQFLRLLNNFCDRDCDNYSGRLLLLSQEERDYVLLSNNLEEHEFPYPRPGLLSKLLQTFQNEPEDSPYKFCIASCCESYLRGSSDREQFLAAKPGLLSHILHGIILVERWHTAGSLQTAFDLLAELIKGNTILLELLVKELDELNFEKLMTVAARNLVDSNVFLRALILTVDKWKDEAKIVPKRTDNQAQVEDDYFLFHKRSKAYLTYPWLDISSISISPSSQMKQANRNELESHQCSKHTVDWSIAPTREPSQTNNIKKPSTPTNTNGTPFLPRHTTYWLFKPPQPNTSSHSRPSAYVTSQKAYLPNTIERMSWFLTANRAQLLCDLLRVVDLRNINHENICCLNTSVVVSIFANRKDDGLEDLLNELRYIMEEERQSGDMITPCSGRSGLRGNDNVIDSLESLHFNDVFKEIQPSLYHAPPTKTSSLNSYTRQRETTTTPNIMQNFRELLWFWSEYYTHSGQDRISLEFYSHLHFKEWKAVVDQLCMDNYSSENPTALLRKKCELPKSPYRKNPRVCRGLDDL